MILGQLFSPENIKLNLESEEKDELFEELTDLYVSNDTSIGREVILTAIRAREEKLSTGIKRESHCRMHGSSGCRSLRVL